MGNMLKQAMDMKRKMEELKERLGDMQVEGSAGGGMVTVLVHGQLTVPRCRLADHALNGNDREMLEDPIVAATNQAVGKVREQLAAKTAEMAAGLGIPPGMLGGLGLGG